MTKICLVETKFAVLGDDKKCTKREEIAHTYRTDRFANTIVIYGSKLQQWNTLSYDKVDCQICITYPYARTKSELCLKAIS